MIRSVQPKDIHAKLACLRRRTWVAIGLCTAFQIGNAALFASEPSSENAGEFKEAESCAADHTQPSFFDQNT